LILALKKIKRRTETVSIALLLTVLLSCSKEDSITCVSNSFSDVYEYPLKPGTQEWIDLVSREERAQACMIPQAILETISTGGLFESLLDYPFIIDYLAWEKFQLGFNKLKSENKGFAELYSREDLSQVIFAWYGSMILDCKEWIYHPLNTAPLSIELQTIEMFIFQDEFLDSINQDREIELFKLIFRKLQLKIKHGYYESEKIISSAILGKIMFRNEFSPFINECNNNDFIKFFIEYIPDYRPVDLSPTEVIEKYADDFYDRIIK
jgi:hypothetical protein